MLEQMIALVVADVSISLYKKVRTLYVLLGNLQGVIDLLHNEADYDYRKVYNYVYQFCKEKNVKMDLGESRKKKGALYYENNEELNAMLKARMAELINK